MDKKPFKYLVMSRNYEYDDQIYSEGVRADAIKVFDSLERANKFCSQKNKEWLLSEPGNDKYQPDFPKDYAYQLTDIFTEGFIWFFDLDSLWKNDQDACCRKVRDIFRLLKEEQFDNVVEEHVVFAMPFYVTEVHYDQHFIDNLVFTGAQPDET